MTQFIWPTTTHAIGDGFGARGGEHQGIDILVGNGSSVHASAAGTITFAGLSGAYGNLIIINHGDGYSTRYGHLLRIDVHSGQQVAQNAIIALSGGIKGAPGSGDATGPHLHFEIRHNGIAINPIPLLNPATPTNPTRKAQPMFGFARNPAGEIAIINPTTGRKRPLTLPEWESYAANGASYAQLDEASYNGIPNE